MNKMTIANALMQMAATMEAYLPTKRAFISTIDENGEDGEEEVPLGTDGSFEYSYASVRWPLDNALIEWDINDRSEGFNALRNKAVACTRRIAIRMLKKGDTFAEAKKEEIKAGLWELYLPGGWSKSQETPWWLI